MSSSIQQLSITFENDKAHILEIIIVSAKTA